MTTLTWIGIALCLTQSAMFSGLNLAVFGVTRLRLEVEADSGNPAAQKVLGLRRDSNFLLTTILWGNVAFNTLLAILSNSLLTGLMAFLFSTILITFVGEIFPQAYFSRNALRMAAKLTPMIRFYQVVLYPVAKPSAKILDWWLGAEGIQYFREKYIREMIKKHIEADEADVDHLEGVGALNFLSLDDLEVVQEGEPVNPDSIISVAFEETTPQFPPCTGTPDDSFLQAVQRSGEKWVIVTDRNDKPQLVLDADGFLRNALFKAEPCRPNEYCHKPLIVHDAATPLGEVLSQFTVEPERAEDDVIDHDIILLWGEQKRVITGADILGRLLRGIVHNIPGTQKKPRFDMDDAD